MRREKKAMTLLIEKAPPRKRQATLEELTQKLSRTQEKAEIVNGEVVKLMATGDEPSSAAFNIALSLKQYQRATGRGRAYTDNIGYLVNLPHRKSFSPAASFYAGPRSGMKFLPGAPLFAVEVRSENAYGDQAEKDIEQKRREYFAAGTEVVWDVDLLGAEVVKCYTQHGYKRRF
jgi:Uma2 family endonuclease